MSIGRGVAGGHVRDRQRGEGMPIGRVRGRACPMDARDRPGTREPLLRGPARAGRGAAGAAALPWPPLRGGVR